MSKWYFTVQPPSDDESTVGGMATESEAQSEADLYSSKFPTYTIGAPFEAADNYLRTLPTAVARIARRDGTEYTQMSDGTIKEDV